MVAVARRRDGSDRVALGTVATARNGYLPSCLRNRQIKSLVHPSPDTREADPSLLMNLPFNPKGWRKLDAMVVVKVPKRGHLDL